MISYVLVIIVLTVFCFMWFCVLRVSESDRKYAQRRRRSDLKGKP